MTSDQLTVTGFHRHSEGLFELALERGGVEFVPGDCLALFGADGQTSRPYSIASGTGEASLRFLIRRMERGVVSPFLAERRPGDRVKVSPPFGWFRPGPREDGSDFVFVATGTGISPFLSHFRTRPHAPPLQCLYGVRAARDAVCADWIAQQCNLRLAVSREAVDGCHHGRVTDLLEAMPCAPRNHYYLCGLDDMIDDLSRWLEAREVPVTHIHRECFFNSSYAMARV